MLGREAICESSIPGRRGNHMILVHLHATSRGFFGKGDMQKEFEEAAFNLMHGEMSSVVQTASGLHLIERWVVVYITGELT